jgi:nitrogen fixation protein NifQ
MDGNSHFGGRQEEFEDLLQLLLDHQSGEAPGAEMVARWVAASCLGENHLWQDMALSNRGALSSILKEYFGPLHEKNTADMKWKKFFYKTICQGEGFYLCKSPSCGVCVDYDKCFGPEV